MLSWIMRKIISPKKMVEMFTVSYTTSTPIDAVVSRVEAACLTHQFALLHHYVYHDVVASKGFPITRKVYVYEVCQAKTASMILTTHPYFAPFMPCRIGIYEDQGQTVVSTMNMGLMLASLQDEPALQKEATALFGTLQSLMKSLI